MTCRLRLLIALVMSCVSAFSAQASEFSPIDLKSAKASIALSVLGSVRGGYFSGKTPANPPAYDRISKRVFVGSVDRRSVDVIDISNPALPTKLFAIDLTPYGGEPNSTAVINGVLAVVVSDAADPRATRNLVFFNSAGVRVAPPFPIPGGSKIKFTADGRKAVLTISGRPSDDLTYDPESAVAILTFPPVDWAACRRAEPGCRIKPKLRIADFARFNDQRQELIDRGVRIYGPNDPTVAQDLETEDFTIAADGRRAWVSLERNNALAVVDLLKARIVDILPLGTKDHSLPGNGLDASDRDGKINIANWPVKSFYQSDAIEEFFAAGKRYLITANEGDPKDFPGYSEKVRVRDLKLDPQAFPDAAILQSNENLGRLQVTSADGDTDGDGDYDELFLLGARSFSIWTDKAKLVFDSGDDFEQKTALAAPTLFNSPEDENAFDQRSDDRGPEPEHLTLGKVGSRTYVFIDFERIGGIIVYDITDPRAPVFQQYINNRNVAVGARTVCGTRGTPELPDCYKAGDVEPEGLVFIPASDSPIREPLLVVIHETSDVTTIYRVKNLLPDRWRDHY